MTYIQFRDKYLGKAIDFDKAYGAQCFDVYRQYCQELGFKQSPPSAGAKDIWNNYLPEHFTKISNTPEGAPPQGSVIIWGVTVGPYGHVAICDHSDTSSFVSIDQNWPVDNGAGVVHYVTHNYKGVLGWLIPKLPIEEIMDTDTKKAIELLTAYKVEKKHGNLEGAINELLALPNQILNLTNKVNDLELKMSEINRTLDNLRLSFVEKEKQEAKWQKINDSANTTINEQNLKIAELDELAKSNRNLYLKKNDEFNEFKEQATKANVSSVVKKLSLLQFIKLKYAKNQTIKSK